MSKNKSVLSDIGKMSNYESGPVSLFDNSPIDSNPTIDLLTIPEVAELLKISVVGMRRLQRGRHIPFVKVGGSIRFTRRDVALFVEKKRIESID